MRGSPRRVSPVVVQSKSQNNLIISVKMHTGEQDIDASALVDSGAEGKFINSRVIQAHGFQIRQLRRPIPVQNVDGSANRAGHITHYTDIPMVLNGLSMKERFLITNTGKVDIILGLPWLKKYNPTINWSKGSL